MRSLVCVVFGSLLVGLLNCSHQPIDSFVKSAETTLRQAAPFPFGAALNPTLLTTNTAYRQTAEHEFSSVTAENHLKMHLVHPAQDRYDWTGSDILVNFAEKNDQRMHGHTLVWHQSVPAWVSTFQGDSTAWNNLLKTHIQTVVGYYKGRIKSWDVVNEAFTDDGAMRPSIWLERLGRDYIARAFRYAHEADSDVLLFYNDYGQEYSLKKRNAILTMIADFKRRDIPIDGVGLQTHTSIRQADSTISNTLRQMAATGLQVHISELDIRVNQAAKADFVPTDDLWQQQKQKFASVVHSYRTLVPKAQQHGITIWNVGDGDSWIPGFCKCTDFPLPFDVKYQKKPAYQGILDGLKQ